MVKGRSFVVRRRSFPWSFDIILAVHFQTGRCGRHELGMPQEYCAQSDFALHNMSRTALFFRMSLMLCIFASFKGSRKHCDVACHVLKGSFRSCHAQIFTVYLHSSVLGFSCLSVVRSLGRSFGFFGGLSAHVCRSLDSWLVARGPRRKNEDLDYRSLDEPVDEGPWHDGPLIVAWGAEEVYHTTKKSGSVGSLSAFTICCVQFRYLVKVQGCMSCTITEARRVTRCVRTS